MGGSILPIVLEVCFTTLCRQGGAPRVVQVKKFYFLSTLYSDYLSEKQTNFTKVFYHRHKYGSESGTKVRSYFAHLNQSTLICECWVLSYTRDLTVV